MKIKFVLPVAQMVLLLLLLRWNNSLEAFANRVCAMPGPTPADELLMSMNAPLLVQRYLNYSLSYPWNVVDQLGAVGLFWYWVAVNISSWRCGGSMITIGWRPARFVLDGVLILLGLSFGLVGVLGEGVRRALPSASYYGLHSVGCFGPNLQYRLLPSMSAAGLYLGWCAVLSLFCGRDLIQGWHHKPLARRAA
jgi:hypothetical protein